MGTATQRATRDAGEAARFGHRDAACRAPYPSLTLREGWTTLKVLVRPDQWGRCPVGDNPARWGHGLHRTPDRESMISQDIVVTTFAVTLGLLSVLTFVFVEIGSRRKGRHERVADRLSGSSRTIAEDALDRPAERDPGRAQQQLGSSRVVSRQKAERARYSGSRTSASAKRRHRPPA